MNENLGSFADRLSDRIGRRVALLDLDAVTAAPREPCIVFGPPARHSSSEARRSNEEDLVQTLRASGADPTVWGSTPPSANGSTCSVAVVGSPFGSHADQAAPERFRVVAFMPAFNEVDIIRQQVQRLLAQGIEVHVIDNWSTDGTVEAIEDLVGNGVTVERFPCNRSDHRYDWTSLLGRIEEAAAAVSSDWCVLHDVDEVRQSPWRDLSLRDSLWRVQQAGANAVDFTRLDFRPVDDSFTPESDLPATLRYCEFTNESLAPPQVKAWAAHGQRPQLAPTGGHDVGFGGRRVFPLNFLLRHYPVRTQAHGERKVFKDRQPRYTAEDIRAGWHYHYARIEAGHRFVRSSDTLHAWDAVDFPRDHLLECCARVGIAVELDGSRRWRLQMASALRRLGLLDQAIKLQRVARARRWQRTA
jgi:glycosyltransferase involved in cell wall biosynthesis